MQGLLFIGFRQGFGQVSGLLALLMGQLCKGSCQGADGIVRRGAHNFRKEIGKLVLLGFLNVAAIGFITSSEPGFVDIKFLDDGLPHLIRDVPVPIFNV